MLPDMALGAEVKLAVTKLSTFMVTVQLLLVDEQVPLQPEKLEILSGIAIKETAVPAPNEDWHEPDIQAIPDGMLLTEPPPLPDILRVNACVAG
jgi:hypothetical protein